MSLLTPILWIEIMLSFIILAIVNFDKPNLNLYTNISLGEEKF
ncbi:hypothetical protein ACK2M7_13850 [Chryseobacterium sp. TY4]